jgi:hypothetical protein
METNKPAGNQTNPDGASDQAGETADLSIADKCAVTFNGHRLHELVTEIDNLADTVCRIVGSKTGGARIPISAADELARFLADIKDEVPELESTRLVHNTLDAAIELAFLHSQVYKDAFEIFRLDCVGQLRGAATAFELVREALNTAKGGE